MSELDYATLHKIKASQVRMLTDRGFNTDNESAIDRITTEQFKEYYTNFAAQNKRDFRNVLSTVYQHRTVPGRLIYVHYTEANITGSQYGKGPVSAIIGLLSSQNIKELIIITHLSLSPAAKGIINSPTGISVQIFDDNELKMVIVDHDLAQKYHLMSKHEESEWFKVFKHSKSSLPIFIPNDPIVKYYNWPSGSVVVITRRHIEGVEHYESEKIYTRVVK